MQKVHDAKLSKTRFERIKVCMPDADQCNVAPFFVASVQDSMLNCCCDLDVNHSALGTQKPREKLNGNNDRDIQNDTVVDPWTMVVHP